MVSVDMSVLSSPLGIMPGKIVGRAKIPDLIDYWLIEFDRDFSPSYPYPVVSVPHIAIITPEEKEKEEEDDLELELKNCDQCGENAWDGYICHNCGAKYNCRTELI
jgi:hypothetical protein